MKADQELIEDTKNGDKAAFSELVKRHQKLLMRVALRITRDLETAEDIVQDSFLKAYQKLSTFKGEASFRSWLCQITINTAKNKLRSRKPTVNIDDTQLSVNTNGEGIRIQVDLQAAVRTEVDLLPAKQKLALTLRIYEDLSFQEIADIMECPYDTAKANFRHGLMKLRHRFQENVGLKAFEGFDSEQHITQVNAMEA
jgi:RNA polymerase sigma-70 factor (ECF subfamily)